ncbi:MAG: sugar phosphate isomerase/epimerase [Phycisphaerales bacterium]|nr:sugar phosphate isomerase/epimerase [Phycisphaerales bacterium]
MPNSSYRTDRADRSDVHRLTRREALRAGAAAIAAGAMPGSALAAMIPQEGADQTKGPSGDSPIFKISLAEWSFHRALYAGELTHLDFIVKAKRDYGLDGVEYVSTFFKDKAKDDGYLDEMKKRCADNGVRSVLIMVDGEGALGDPDDAKRAQAVENHHKWVDAGKRLGCHSIRVNAQSDGSWEEQRRLAADGLRRLTEYGAANGLNVIVENHGGLSSNGKWLSEVMRAVDHPRCGTLPDFGNFRLHDDEWYDRYKGVAELMPFAKAVSAKTHEFDEHGFETKTDYMKMIKIVLDAGYRGYIGIEYEGSKVSEDEGVRATKRLLERVRAELAPKYGSK